jgi:lariat debranching enzyme
MKIAVEGCCHGELDAIYASLTRLQREKSQQVDLLLIGGDFQVYPPPTPSSPLIVVCAE